MDTATATIVILAVGLNTLLGAMITAAITWSILRAYYRLPASELRTEAARLREEAARLRELHAAPPDGGEQAVEWRTRAELLEAEVERLRAELERTRRPWWRRWFGQ
jgi:hypothetical protein